MVLWNRICSVGRVRLGFEMSFTNLASSFLSHSMNGLSSYFIKTDLSHKIKAFYMVQQSLIVFSFWFGSDAVMYHKAIEVLLSSAPKQLSDLHDLLT